MIKKGNERLVDKERKWKIIVDKERKEMKQQLIKKGNDRLVAKERKEMK